MRLFGKMLVCITVSLRPEGQNLGGRSLVSDSKGRICELFKVPYRRYRHRRNRTITYLLMCSHEYGRTLRLPCRKLILKVELRAGSEKRHDRGKGSQRASVIWYDLPDLDRIS